MVGQEAQFPARFLQHTLGCSLSVHLAAKHMPKWALLFLCLTNTKLLPTLLQYVVTESHHSASKLQGALLLVSCLVLFPSWK